MATDESTVSSREARNAGAFSGCDHHAVVRSSVRAPSSVLRLRENVPTSCLSSVKAAIPKLSMEKMPGHGPSASTSSEI